MLSAATWGYCNLSPDREDLLPDIGNGDLPFFISLKEITMSNRSSQAVRHNNAQSTQGASAYFDLHTRGCGYLSRVRWVTTTSRGRKSDPFLCCAINALHDDVDAPSYTYFDLRVTGTDAQQLVASLEQ